MPLPFLAEFFVQAVQVCESFCNISFYLILLQHLCKFYFTRLDGLIMEDISG